MMKNSEYNVFEEFQKTQENKSYQAIQNSVNSKESFLQKDETLVSKEYINTDSDSKIIKNKENRSIIKKLIQKITETTSSLASSVATTAIVVVTSVVIFSSILISPPHIELLELSTGYDYVSYNIFIDEMDENMDYYSVISNNFENHRYELIEGENLNYIDNLKHDMKYELSIIGVGKQDQQEVEYFNTVFYTTINIEKIKVKWVVEGKTVEEYELEEGDTPVYNGDTPTKESDDQFIYNFLQWNKTIELNGDITYIAEFQSIVRKYLVKWEVEGKIVEEYELEYGQTPVYNGEIPSKENTSDITYEFIGWDKEITPITKDVTYVALFKEITYEYTAKFTKFDTSDVIINYDNEDYYEIIINTEFDNSSDTRLLYRIILTDIKTNNTYKYEGIDSIAKINVPSSVEELAISYEYIGIYDGIEKVFDTITIDENLKISIITVEIGNELTLVNTGEYLFTMLINSEFAEEEVYNSVELVIRFNDASTNEIFIDEVVVNEEMEIMTYVPQYCGSLNVEYTINLLGKNGHNQRVIKGQKEIVLETSYELLDLFVDAKDNMRATFSFKYHLAEENITIAVKDVSTNEVVMLTEEYNYIEIQLTSTQHEFIYYLSTLDNEPIDTGTNIAIDASDVNGVYSFDYVNPNDAIVTFNKDQSMNIYLNTFFETDDPDIYYLVRYIDFNSGKNYDMKYTESVAYIENLPFSDYGIEYYVYKTIGGVEYYLESVFVSGGIEIMHDSICESYVETDESNNLVLYVYFSDYFNVNLDEFVLLIDGEEEKILSTDFVLSDGTYELIYNLDTNPTKLILQYMGTYNDRTIYETVSSAREIKGQQYRTMYLIIYE